MRQLSEGEEYHLLQPVYSLNFVNETFEPDMEEYYHYYHMVHYLHSDKVLEGLHLVFVELPKFKARNLTEKKMQVLWLRFLTEIGEKTRKAPQDLLDNPQVNQALEIVEESAYNEAEMLAYDKFWDRASRERTFQVNLERALAQCDAIKAQADAERTRAETEWARADAAVAKLRQDKLQTARTLKAMNLTDGQIAAATGLTADEVAAL